jgi:hypothetical protein
MYASPASPVVYAKIVPVAGMLDILTFPVARSGSIIPAPSALA